LRLAFEKKIIAVIPAKTYWTFVVLISFWVLLCRKISASLPGLPLDQSPIYRSATFADTAGGCFKCSYPNKG